MRKKSLFLSLLLCLLFPLGAWAQLTEGTYYLYNVGADAWLNYGGDDDYTACFKPHGEPVVLAASGDGFTIQTALDSRYLSATATEANARQSTGSVFTFTVQSDGSYSIQSSEGYMGYVSPRQERLSQTLVHMNLESDATDDAHWMVLTEADLRERLNLATAENPVDATFFITCPNFDRHHAGLGAWSDYMTGNNTGYLCNNAAYKFDSGTTVQQVLSGVPNGLYQLKAQAFYRHGSNGTATGYTEETMPLHGYMFAGSDEVLVKSILSSENLASTDIYGSYGRSFGGGYIPYGASNNYAGACIAFDNGFYAGNELQTTVTDGSLTIGFKIDELTQYSWIAYDNIELYYLGPLQDLTPLKQKYYDLRTMIMERFVNQTEVYTDEEGAAQAAYQNVVDAQDAIVENATTEEEIDGAKEELWNAALTFIKSVKIKEGQAFDMTSFMVNPEVTPSSSTTATGWTTTANLDFGSSYQITQFSTSVPFDMHQVIANMPAGQYKVRVRGFFRPGAFSSSDMTSVANAEVPTLIYLNETTQPLVNICADGSPTQLSKGASTKVNDTTIYIPNSRSHLDPFFEADYYWNEMHAVTSADGDLTIGLKYDTFTSGGWGVISDFHLYYSGALDLSEWEQQLELVVNEAQALDIPTAPKDALNAIIDEYNLTYITAEDYQNAIAQINTAKAEAEAYVEPYAQYKAMKEMVNERFISQTDVYTDEAGAVEAFNTATATADSRVEDVETVEALQAEIDGLWAEALAFLKNVTINEGKAFDFTWMIKDADFSDTNYKNYWTEVLTQSGTIGVTSGLMRYYTASFDLGQTLDYTLPAGLYRLHMDGFERTNSPMQTAYDEYAAGNSVVTGMLYFNSTEQAIHNLFDYQEVKDNSLGGKQPTGASFYIPDGSSASAQYLNAGYYPNLLNAVLTEDGTVTLGYRCANTNAWTCFDNFRLEYVGMLDLSDYQEQLALLVNAANELVLPTAQKDKLDGVIAAYNKEYFTAEDYQAAIEAITTAKNAAEPFVEPYAQYKTMKEMVNERFISQTDVYTDEAGAVEAFNTATATADTRVEAVETVEALQAEIDGLWTEALTFLKNVTINEGKGFDLTWMIQDADFSDTNYKKYWNETCTSSNAHGVVGGNNILRYYNSPFDVNQTLPYILPAGAYRMKVDGFERTNDPMNTAWSDYQAGNSTVTGVIYLNTNEQTVMNLFDVQSVTNNSLGGEQPSGASFYIANNSNGASKYIDAGYYPNTLIAVLPEDGEATIGYRCANSVAWTAVDNFQLEYIGEVPQTEIAVTAGELLPMCVPFTLNVADESIDELYEVGSVVEGEAQLYPVNSVLAGTPCYVKFNTATYRAPVETTSSSTFVLPWDGGLLSPDMDNMTWKYINLQDEQQEASTLTPNCLDLMAMDIAINMENLAARKFLTNVSYTSASSSVVAKYNVAPPTRRDIPNAVMLPVPENEATSLTLTYSENEDYTDAVTATLEAGTEMAAIYNLEPQKTFFYKIEADAAVITQGRFATTGRLRMVYAPTAYNIRDFGGWLTEDGHRTNYGHLFRGSTLNGYAQTTAEDLQRLRGIGVGAEIDLRWKSDYDKDMGCGTSAFGFTTATGDYYFAAANDYLASDINNASTQARWKQEFEFIVNNFRQGKAVYFHCAWGADRTGLLALLLEGLLGYQLDQIYKDYELTSFSAAPGASNRLKTSFQDRIDVFQGMSGATLRDKVEGFFLNKLGVSQEDIDYFRTVMLDEEVEPIPEPEPYQFVATDWQPGDPGRISPDNVTYDTDANTITVSQTGKNNICLKYATTTQYVVAPELRYFVIRGTGFSTEDTKTYLWWLNNANHGSQVPPSTVYEEDGETVFAWDILTCGLGDNFSATEPTQLATDGDYITTFGLTLADAAVPAVITYIGFVETVAEPIVESEYVFDANLWVAGDPGRISSSNVTVDTEANTITVDVTGTNNVNLVYRTNEIHYVEGADYFVIRGTGLSLASGMSYLWWLNGENQGTQIPPTSATINDETGIVTLLWNIADSGIGNSFNADRTYLLGNLDGWNTCFGLTLADSSVPAVISYIGFDKEDSPYVGIEALSSAERQESSVYDLSGRRVQRPSKGLYIIDGKKVFIK